MSTDDSNKDENKKPLLTFGKREAVDKPETAVLSNTNSRWRQVLKQPFPNGTATLGKQREVIFVIRGMIERVIMNDSVTITLGRFESGTQPNRHIDLNPYGALDRGVSRVHAQLRLKGDRLYITDLGSTNGTYLAGKRLEANKAELLRKGDELLLGRLAVQILFR